MNYVKRYNLLIERAQERICPDGYYEVHHIIPTSLGGSSHQHNLVKLTLKEHRHAHMLLYKIFGEDQIFSIKCFYDMKRHQFFHIRTMPKWVRKKLTIRQAELKRQKWIMNNL